MLHLNNVLISFGIIKFIGKPCKFQNFFFEGQTPNIGHIIKLFIKVQLVVNIIHILNAFSPKKIIHWKFFLV